MTAILKILKPDLKLTHELTTALECHPLLSTLLVNRKITTRRAALDFLYPALKNIRPPDTLCDVDAAVDRIAAALENHEKILVFGDYDVDGITATCLLTEFLRETGADVSFYIPHRIDEGYSLNAQHIRNGAVPAGTKLLITVDCGTSSLKAVSAAAAAGIDVVITDHHTVTRTLPAAAAVVNPRRDDCQSGLGGLAGVGVIFYIVIALRRALRERGYFSKQPEPNLKKWCDLVALGTVADMVPLVQENRIFTAVGLEVINTGKRPGLNRLIQNSRLSEGRVDSEDIAYKLAPRLNAAGRLKHAAVSVNLLSASTGDFAGEIAATLENLNNERRKIEQAMLTEILSELDRSPSRLSQPALVMSSPEWHPGVIGIVAARLARQFNRPVFLVALRDGLGKGSGRSVAGLDILSCVEDCARVLERYGGHPAAAGISIMPHNLKEFEDLFNVAVQKRVGQGIPPHIFRIDCEIQFSQIQNDLMEVLDLLKPFGQENPDPLFIARGIQILSAQTVGQGHSRLVLSQKNGRQAATLPGIFFNSGTLPENAESAVFNLHWNHWKGRKNIQAIVKQLI